MRSIEPGISRFRVWSFGPSRNDDKELRRCRAQQPVRRRSRLRHVRYYHFGEGEYGKTEEAIRTLLGARAPVASGLADESPHGLLTPESYLGYKRLDRNGGDEIVPDKPHAYTLPAACSRTTRPRRHLGPCRTSGRWPA